MNRIHAAGTFVTKITVKLNLYLQLRMFISEIRPYLNRIFLSFIKYPKRFSGSRPFNCPLSFFPLYVSMHRYSHVHNAHASVIPLQIYTPTSWIFSKFFQNDIFSPFPITDCTFLSKLIILTAIRTKFNTFFIHLYHT